MGTIPTFTTSPGMVPSGAVAPLIDTNAMTLPYVAQAQSGKELANVADQFANKYIDAKLQVDAANQSSDISKALQQVQFEAGKIPDRDRATIAFDAGSQKVLDDYQQSGANPLVKAHVQSRIMAEVAHRRADVQQASFKLWSETQRGQLDEQLNGIAKEAATITDPRLRDIRLQAGLDAIDGRVAGGALNPEAGAQAKINFKSTVYRGIIETELAKSPEQGVAAFKQFEGQLNARDAAHLRTVTTGAEKGIEINTQAIGILGGGGQITSVVGQLTAVLPDIKDRITSADRDVHTNEKVGGASNSQHLQPGKAVDISLAGLPQDKQQEVVDKILSNPDVGGVGVYGDHIHVDTRSGQKTAWSTAGAPAWMKEKTAAWTGGGDGFAAYQTKKLGEIRDYAINGPGNLNDRLAVVQKAHALLGTQSAFNTAQRKQIDDDAQTASTGLFTGDYKDGTFASIADRFRATGDNHSAAVYDILAANEQPLKNFAEMPPGAQRTFGHLLPGAAGKIALATLADQRLDRTELRKEAVRQHTLLTEGVQRGLPAESLAANAQEAVTNYMAAGDAASAKKVFDEYRGLVEGNRLAGLPTGRAEEELRNLKERADSGLGLDVKTQAALQALENGIQKNKEKWANDPIVAAERWTGKLDPYQPTAPDAERQLWANRRVQQAQVANQLKDPQATVQTVPLMTQTELADMKSRLMKGSIENRQHELVKLATALPNDQIPLVAKAIAGNDPLGDSWATAMTFYKRNQPGDMQIADSLIRGSNKWMEGGPEGKDKVDLNAATFVELNSYFGTAYRGEGRDIKTQNNAVMSRYVDLGGGKDGKTVDTSILKQAAQDVLGTAMHYHGADHLLPSNVQAYQFEDAIAGITPADLPPLRPAGTTEITADRIKRSATYQAVGDGLYKVWMPDPKQGGTHEVLRQDGRPWVIDIRPLIARGVAGSLESRFGVMPQGEAGMK